MAARAILTPKSSSILFEDRCVDLTSPARVGRSHKDDRSDSSNGIFECKVLSRNHALLVFEEGKFFIVDTGSSNGTFVNNIRLSKCGEESKPTELFTADSLRFGSDVVDKAKNITQKCVVARIQLFYPDGSEYEARPQTSRLFRPNSGDDMNGGGGSNELELVLGEKEELTRKLSNIELQLAEREMFFSSVGAKQERDATEITKLRLLVDSQNSDIANLEAALGDTQSQLEKIQDSANQETERRMFEVMSKYEDQIKHLEETRQAEESRLKQQLQEVTGNEVHLLDRIKSLESESEYAQAEVEKIVVKESNEFEYKQELEYNIQCLSTELEYCRAKLEEAEANKTVERSEEDVKLLEEKDQQLVKLREEVSYYKKELIDARSRKTAAEDELNTVKGTVETLNNSSTGLSNEIEQLNETIKVLNKNLEEETVRANHLEGLVSAMEAQPEVEARSKVEIEDLKSSLAASQSEVKARLEEILTVKDNVRLERETVQQRDIEISRLNGKLQFLEEEIELIKSRTGDISGLEAEINSQRNTIKVQTEELEVGRSDNVKLTSELQQMQILYSELKKMRGRGEELELLEVAQRDVVEARDAAQEYHGSWQEALAEINKLQEINNCLSRENSKLLETSQSSAPPAPPAPPEEITGPHGERGEEKPPGHPGGALLTRTVAAGEAVMANIGSLKLYEILFGLLFISIVISWNPFTI